MRKRGTVRDDQSRAPEIQEQHRILVVRTNISTEAGNTPAFNLDNNMAAHFILNKLNQRFYALFSQIMGQLPGAY